MVLRVQRPDHHLHQWASEQVKIDAELAKWIKENSVHYPVRDFLYNKPVEEQS